ncbi:hypothetical protein EQW76_00775 [Rhizobium sp. rho-13.1]|uniref:hypothetical protein n=1 Tax=Rhizobium sp. rho-13.1 TaxID=2506431 RepID=UPI00115D8BE4|nr:hypothetical protein [Rhizobium sp. rho-13.1]TQX91302.1 hypothetical protein EQW76_00775 [Rhizobium sp. rho-13.1]
MSHTLIPDHRDRMLALENVANRLQKHCRIVNVQWKPRTAPAFNGIFIGSPPTKNGCFATSASDN